MGLTLRLLVGAPNNPGWASLLKNVRRTCIGPWITGMTLMHAFITNVFENNVDDIWGNYLAGSEGCHWRKGMIRIGSSQGGWVDPSATPIVVVIHVRPSCYLFCQLEVNAIISVNPGSKILRHGSMELMLIEIENKLCMNFPVTTSQGLQVTITHLYASPNFTFSCNSSSTKKLSQQVAL